MSQDWLPPHRHTHLLDRPTPWRTYPPLWRTYPTPGHTQPPPPMEGTWYERYTSAERTWDQRQPPPEQTDTRENITFPQLPLRAVMICPVTGAVVSSRTQSFSFSSLRPRWVVSPAWSHDASGGIGARNGYPIVRVLLVVCILTTLHLGRDDRGKENTVSPP